MLFLTKEFLLCGARELRSQPWCETEGTVRGFAEEKENWFPLGWRIYVKAPGEFFACAWHEAECLCCMISLFLRILWDSILVSHPLKMGYLNMEEERFLTRAPTHSLPGHEEHTCAREPRVAGRTRRSPPPVLPLVAMRLEIGSRVESLFIPCTHPTAEHSNEIVKTCYIFFHSSPRKVTGWGTMCSTPTRPDFFIHEHHSWTPEHCFLQNQLEGPCFKNKG